jgi:hypothetical protein
VMAKEPAERFATCADFASALAGVGASVGPTEVIATAPAPPVPPATSAPSRGKRRGPGMVIAALVAVALVAVAAVIGVRMFGARHHRAGGPSSSVAPTVSTAPSAPSLKLTSQITDRSGVLGPLERAGVDRALTKLFDGSGTRLWVVYVNNFGDLKPIKWAEDTMRANGFGDTDAILAMSTDQPAFSFRVPNAVIQGKAIDLEVLRRDRIGPAVLRHEWARAAIAAANGLDVPPS